MSETDESDWHGIKPHWIYRKTSHETHRIIGLKASAIAGAIKDGTLPPPIPLTADGKSKGWMGWQLIQVMQQRAARLAGE